MLPALPSRPTPALDALALTVAASSSALGKGLHPIVLSEIAQLMARVNSYYTNAMEGNPSKLRDIDAALAKRFSKDRTERNHQLEHVAHLKVQREMLDRLRAEPALDVCSEAFLRWLHERFFAELPPELRFAVTESGERVPVEGGRLRDRGVSVGRHEAPSTLAAVRAGLGTFAELLSPDQLEGPRRLIGFAASHHRFLWIHPFPEGNGRVARLMTTAYGHRLGLGEGELWTVARAFARSRADYDGHLTLADQPRRNDLDGRGPLSEENLIRFCEYFLRSCEDQIRFMSERLRLEKLEDRHRLRVSALVARKKLSKTAARAADKLLVMGEIPRGDLRGLCEVAQRRASQIARELTASGVARSASPRAPLRLNFDADAAAFLFPDLA